MNSPPGPSQEQFRIHRLVRRFGRLGAALGNSRFVFRAAPVIGALAAATALGTFLVFAIHGGWWLLLVLTIIEAAILAVGIYLMLVAIAAVEYDNEQKARSVALANEAMHRYADRTHRDLARASKAQRNLLPNPQNMPLPAHVEWAASFAPEAEVGGDYYDAAELPGRRVGVLLCDVSGHGMSAALITTLVKSAFLAWTDEDRPIEEFIRRANDHLCRFTPDGAFAAMIACEYDAASRSLRYVNAGHSPKPVLVPADADRPPQTLDSGGCMILGVLPDIEIEVASAALLPGDSVFFITDGLAEAANADREMFGLARLMEVLAAARAGALWEMVDAMSDHVEHFAAGVEPTDDRTVLAMRVRR